MLELQHISYGVEQDGENKDILLDINLTIQERFVAITGPNGGGKSTLAKVIAGILTPTEGEILLDGEDITYQRDYRRALNIGCLFQNPLRGTSPNMTIEENLALAYTRKSARSFFAVNRRDSALFRAWLARLDMGLENRLGVRMGALSGGQRQAAALLMATIARPKLLLLDEHTAALDPAASEKVLCITREIVAEHGLTTLMITHDMHDALSCGNRTLLMDAGRPVLDIRGEAREGMTPRALTDLFTDATRRMPTDRSMLKR